MHLVVLQSLCHVVSGILHPQMLELNLVACRGCAQAYLGPDEC